jgi:DNA-binding LacI/PurR family transcriptional regulator
MSSLGALHAAKSRQVRVPKDLSVVGFDDMFFAPYLQPPLTTIRQPKCGMGKRAMELLLDLLAGKKPEKVVMIQGKLLVRSSTAPPEGKK